MSLLTILVVALLVCALLGFFGHPRVGYYGWSPAAAILLVILILVLTGHLR